MALTKIPANLLDKSAHVDFADNEKLRLGTSQDLQIYHDASNSYIKDQGDGQLVLDGNAVILQYSSGTKFETSATGATVTGNLAVTGDLDITGNVNSASVTDLDVTDKTITLGAGQTEALSGGSGLIIDGSSASFLWNETDNRFDYNRNLHIGTAAGQGTSSSPALQIGGGATYRLGLYTDAEGGIIQNLNGDDGLQFRVKTAGEAMRIDGGTGNVGIGVTSSYPLTVQSGTAGSNHAIALRNNSTNNLARLGFLQQDSATAAYTSIDGDGRSTGYLRFNTNDTERMRIDSSGNVGIGNTPQTIYPTFDSLQIGPNKSAILGRSENNLFGTTSNTYINSSGSWTYVNNGLAAMTEMINGEHHWFTASSGTAGNAITFQRRMSIMSSGNVGIGTNSPTEKLTVNGAITATGALTDDRTSTAAMDFSSGVTRFVSYGASGTGGIFAFRTASGGASSTEKMRIDSSGNVQIANGGKLVTKTTSGEVIRFERASDSLRYSSIHANSTDAGGAFIQFKVHTGASATSLADVMTLKGNGNVGIGTTSPGAKLEISGKDDAGASDLLALQFDNSPADTGMTFTDIFSGVKSRFTLDSSNTNDLRISSATQTHFYGGTSNGTGDGHLKITSDGQVVKPYQSGFYAVKSSAQTISVNQAVIFNTTTENVGGDYNTSNGIYTAPYSGFYVFAYTILLGPNLVNDIDVDHYLKTSNRNYIGGMPGRHRYLTTGTTGWGDGYMGLGHTQIAYMDAGDTAYVDFSQLYYNNSNGSAPVYANSGNNWTKFSGYFLG